MWQGLAKEQGLTHLGPVTCEGRCETSWVSGSVSSFLGTHSGRTFSCVNERSFHVDHADWGEAGIHRWGELRKRLGNQACCETGRPCPTWNKTMKSITLLNYSSLFKLGILVPTAIAITIPTESVCLKLPLAAILWDWYYCIHVSVCRWGSKGRVGGK